jgi:hypothetical protein
MSVLIDVKRKSPTCPQVFIMNLCTLILYSNKNISIYRTGML